MQDPSTGYFRTVNNHLRFQQGAELAEDLELELMHKSNIMHEKIVGFLSRSNIEREVEDKLAEHPQWIHTFAEHLTALVHMRAKRYADAAEAQLRCHRYTRCAADRCSYVTCSGAVYAQRSVQVPGGIFGHRRMGDPRVHEGSTACAARHAAQDCAQISEDLRKVAVMADTETGSVEQEKLVSCGVHTTL
jgi:hypothetical protein